MNISVTCFKNSTGSDRKKRNVDESSKLANVRRKRETLDVMEADEIKSHGTMLRYECGLARKFYDEGLEEQYDERFMTCNFNKTWTEHDYIDECVWIQCLYPPEPPKETNLKLIWDGSPINFTESVSYVCKEDDLYFESDRELQEYTVQCLPGGSWDAPDTWPRCLHCKSLKYFFIPFNSIIFSCELF